MPLLQIHKQFTIVYKQLYALNGMDCAVHRMQCQAAKSHLVVEITDILHGKDLKDFVQTPFIVIIHEYLNIGLAYQHKEDLRPIFWW